MTAASNRITSILDLERFPLDRPESAEYRQLVQSCRDDLQRHGMFNLHGLLRADACDSAVSEIAPIMENQSFEHRRAHNIYFLDHIPGLPPDHPALGKVETINHTVCADQIEDSVVMRIYAYEPLLEFLAEVMEKENLFMMDDPLARANVMAYHQGEALNWHFDRSEFTITLLLQSPDSGGVFEYRSGLRSAEDPNYPGVERLLSGKDPERKQLALSPGTLNVFRGKNTAHRVTPVAGDKSRMVAVFSYYEQPGVRFSEQERVGFYGRAQ